MAGGWNETMLRKVKIIQRAIEENWGTIFVYSDVDVQFLAPAEETIRAAMDGFDMAIQKDSPSNTACAGFFACVANEKTRALWDAVADSMVKAHGKLDDQSALNKVLRENPIKGLSWKFLPDSFFGGGTFRPC